MTNETMIKISMPKACISCERYSHKGYDQDKHCPFQKRSALAKDPVRTPWGFCSLHGVEVFATQLCASHEPEPFANLVDVTNRCEPRTPIQELML